MHGLPGVSRAGITPLSAAGSGDLELHEASLSGWNLGSDCWRNAARKKDA